MGHTVYGINKLFDKDVSLKEYNDYVYCEKNL
jgi:hypothetical protein